jgi:hypothetical protein
MSIDATTERLHTQRVRRVRLVRPSVSWLTLVPLAVVMAYADGFWMTSLRGAVGAVSRTQQPFETWLRESTLSLPFFILAVLGALTLAVRWFGPVLRKPKSVLASALLVIVAGTLVGIAEVGVSSAYDYHLQSSQLQQMDSMPGMQLEPVGSAMGAMMASTMGSMGSTQQQQHASLLLQVRALGLGSGLLLASNFVLVGWVVAMRGGRIDVSRTRR